MPGINRWLRSRKFWILLLVGVLLVSTVSSLPVEAWLAWIKDWITSLGPLAMPGFALVYLLATILGLPSMILMVIAGTLFGLVRGVWVVSLADTLGAIACFWIGRTIARKWIKRWISRHPNFAQLDQAVADKGWQVLLLTRLSPLLPSNLLNYGFSCTKVNFWQYCLFSWLGMLPIIGLYVYLGAFGSFIFGGTFTPQKLALQFVGLLITIAAAVYTTRLARRALSPTGPVPDQETALKSR